MEDLDAATAVYVTILLLLMIFTICGNYVLIYILLTRKHFRIVGNYYIVSLSVSDIFIGVFVVSSVIVSLLKKDTPFEWCYTSPFLEMVAFTGGIFSLINISYDRFQAVVRATRYAPVVKTAVIRVVCVWTAAVFYSCRIFLQFEITKLLKREEKVSTSSNASLSRSDRIEFCNVLNEEDPYDLHFRVVDFVLLFLIPMVLMTYLYYRIIQQLWSTKIELTSSIQRNKRVIKMLVINIAVFFVCWIPFYLQDIIIDGIEYAEGITSDNDDEDEEDDDNAVLRSVRLFFIFLTLAHSILNPIIYFISNSKFREELIVVKSRIICCSRKTNSVAPSGASGTQNVSRDNFQQKDTTGTCIVEENTSPKLSREIKDENTTRRDIEASTSEIV